MQRVLKNESDSSAQQSADFAPKQVSINRLLCVDTQLATTAVARHVPHDLDLGRCRSCRHGCDDRLRVELRKLAQCESRVLQVCLSLALYLASPLAAPRRGTCQPYLRAHASFCALRTLPPSIFG
jgi:hypothetical protein